MIIVTIDGGASTGKSTVAKIVAEKSNLVLINSGMFYRYITAILLKTSKMDYIDTPEVQEIINTLHLNYFGDNITSIEFGDLSDEIFARLVSENVSKVAEVAYIRNKVTQTLRTLDLLENPSVRGIVMEGRDIGTVVFPAARYKFYLTVSDEVAAQRRYKEFQQKNVEISYEEVLENIKTRNKTDSTRAVAPLKKPLAAMEISTDNLTPDQVAKTINDYIMHHEK